MECSNFKVKTTYYSMSQTSIIYRIYGPSSIHDLYILPGVDGVDVDEMPVARVGQLGRVRELVRLEFV